MVKKQDAYSKVLEPTQDTPIDGKVMVKNHGGAYVFGLDDFARLDRFLVLGSEGGSYYANERTLTMENAKSLENCIKLDGERVVARIVEMSLTGRAPKQEPLLFSLAMASVKGDEKTRKAALAAVSKVCRTATHLFAFAEYRNTLGGWNRSLRNTISKWYNDKPINDVSYQMVKYRNRNGWEHRDLLRLAHVKPVDEQHGALYQWAVGKGDGEAVELVKVFNEVQKLKANSKADVKRACALIRKHRLPREALPTELLNVVDVWEALLEDMPMTAMIRNLGNMTKNGLLVSGSDAVRKVVDQLGDTERLRKARVHPISVLSALTTYQSGASVKGDSTWTPVRRIVDALDEAFYESFGNVTPTGKRLSLNLDVSGSMSWHTIAGVAGLTPAMASSVMAMVTARVEKDYAVYGFGSHLMEIDISPKMRLDEVVKRTQALNFGGTDCSLPMIMAKKNKSKFDAFVVYTDNETNTLSGIHPSRALAEYRDSSGIADAALIVVGMESNSFSIADPSDNRMLDIVGFDSAAPEIMSSFMRGDF